MTTVKYFKRSICPCGFPTLNEDVPMGTEYEVDLSAVASFTFICGGCKKEHQIQAILAAPRGSSHGGFLPMDIFDFHRVVDHDMPRMFDGETK